MLFQRLYGPVYGRILFPLYDRYLKRRKIYTYYRQISANPWLPRDVLHEMRQRKLRDLLIYASEHVPFYRSLLRERGIDARNTKNIDTLREKGVLTSKEIVRAAGDSIISDEYRKEDLNQRRTSGTSGTPLTVYVTLDNWNHRMATKYRTDDWIGKSIGAPSVYIWGHPTELGPLQQIKRKLYWKLQNYMFLSAFDIGEESLARSVEAIRSFGARFIEAYVNAVYLMAKVIRKRNMTAPRLDGIVIGGERLLDFQKDEIEAVFDCPVYNRYGSSEFMNIACECLMHRGMHINDDNLWVEVVDGDGRPIIGEEGDIVITDFNNYTMPLIRYRIGDRGVLSDRSCPCGRSFTMLEDVIGRQSEIIKTPDGREIHGMYLHWKFRSVPGVYRYQVVQESLDRIAVRVVHDRSVALEETAGLVGSALKELEAMGIAVELEFVDEIALTDAGKTLFFVSRL